MKHPKTMDFQALKHDIRCEMEDRTLKILSEDENSITILDLADIFASEPKEITFTNPNAVNARWLRSHIWIHPKITELLKDDLVSGLLEMDLNTFITLRHLVIVPSLDDLKDYIKDTQIQSLLDTAPAKHRTKDNPIGQFWYQANCAIIFYNNVKHAAYDTICETLSRWESFHMWETIFHELRHLMLDGNPFLPTSDYPVQLASEDAVEEFCREEYNRIFLSY